MADIPSELRYTAEHEYITPTDEDGVVLVGITHYAQGELGDVVYVELPEVGKAVAKGDEAAVVESVKAASEIYAPVSGEVVAVNTDLEGAPAAVNEDAAGKGWFLKLKLKDPSELEGLMTEQQYQEFLKSIS